MRLYVDHKLKVNLFVTHTPCHTYPSQYKTYKSKQTYTQELLFYMYSLHTNKCRQLRFSNFFFIKIYLQHATHSFALLSTHYYTYLHRHLRICICFICYFVCTFAVPRCHCCWQSCNGRDQQPTTKHQAPSGRVIVSI